MTISVRWTGLAQAAAVTVAVGCQACAGELPRSVRAQPAVVQLAADDASLGAVESSAPALSLYSPVGKRDPFTNPAMAASNANPPRTPKSGLELYDLDELRLVFTQTATSSPLAVVLDPSGHGHYVRIGDRIGKNSGSVSAIKQEELTVMHAIDSPGRVYPDYSSIRMQDSSSARPSADYDLRLSDASSVEN